MITDVFMICDAYEAGYGKGQVQSPDVNPYKKDSCEYEAWNIGYQKAINIELERFRVLPTKG